MLRPTLSRADHARERGSSTVEFVLVAPLVLLVALAVVQLGLALHVRATLTSAAAEGARAASLAGADAEAGVRRTTTLLEESLTGSVVRRITARPAVVDTLDVMVVRVEARLPLVGLLGPAMLDVEGRALREGWSG
jgi:Flp pilus assembly protein TadG